MEKTIRLLILVLGIQLILALWLGKSGLDLDREKKMGPLLEFEKDKISKITIEGPEDTQVVLEKNGEHWQLPALNNFRANDEQVSQFLDRLAELETDTPTTTSEGAIERFKVAESNYERRINLESKSGNTIATLFLGDSPRVRHSYARLADENNIYNVELAAYDVSELIPDWIDKTQLKIAANDVTAIKVGNLELKRVRSQESLEDKDLAKPEQEWQSVTALAEDEKLNFGSVNTLLNQLENLRYDEVLDQKASESYGMEKPLLKLDISYGKNQTRSYYLGKIDGLEQYALKVSDRPEYFQLPGSSGKQLLETATREMLIVSTAKAQDNNDATIDALTSQEDQASEADQFGSSQAETDEQSSSEDSGSAISETKLINGVIFPADADIEESTENSDEPQPDSSSVSEKTSNTASDEESQPYRGHQVLYAEEANESKPKETSGASLPTGTKLIDGVIFPADAEVPSTENSDDSESMAVPSKQDASTAPYSGHEVMYAE